VAAAEAIADAGALFENWRSRNDGRVHRNRHGRRPNDRRRLQELL
jgi:hypothetical protein